MFLVDDLLVRLPLAGFRFVLRQIANVADQELVDDPARIREELLALNQAYDSGAIDEATFKARERELLARWRAVRPGPR